MRLGTFGTRVPNPELYVSRLVARVQGARGAGRARGVAKDRAAMRRLLCILGFFAVCAGCNVKGADFPNHRLVPTPTPSPTPGQSLANLSSFCQDAPTLTLPGTYPAFELNGVLTGTTFAPVSTDELFEYADFVAGSPTPTPTATPSPNPSASPYDVWSGTVTYTGTAHNSTICFLAASYVSRVDFIPGANTELLSDPGYDPQTTILTNAGTQDQIENVVLTLSTTSASSGSFTLAGGGQATINITSHGVFTDSEARRQLNAAIAAHKLLGPRR